MPIDTWKGMFKPWLPIHKTKWQNNLKGSMIGFLASNKEVEYEVAIYVLQTMKELGANHISLFTYS